MTLKDFIKYFIESYHSNGDNSRLLQSEYNARYVDELLSIGIKSEDYIRNNNLNENIWARPIYALDALICSSAMSRIQNVGYYDQLVSNIIKHKKRSFETSLFEYGPKSNPTNVNLCRDSSGNLHPEIFFKKIQSKTNLHAVLQSISAFDDAEALLFLRTIPFYQKSLTGIVLERSLNGIEIKSGSLFHKQLLSADSDASAIDPIKYINLLLSLNSKSHEDCTGLYQKELSEKHGHAFLGFTLGKWHIEKCDAQLPLVTKMVEDGADWYLAFMQVSINPSIYLDLLGRNKDPKAELVHMINEWDTNPSIKRNRIILRSMLQGMPLSLLQSANEDKKTSGIIKRLIKAGGIEIENNLSANVYN
jgi:hypothetical protein